MSRQSDFESVRMELITDEFTERKHRSAGFLLQARLLIKKNWLSKIRMERKKLIGELLVPVLYLLILCLMVKFVDKHKKFDAETESYETKTNVFTSGSIRIHMAPNTTFTKNIAESMSQLLSLQSQAQILFEFYESESQLVEKYNLNNKSNPFVNYAMILPSEEETNFNYSIRINPDVSFLPSILDKTVDLSTCRGRNSKQDGLEFITTCPVNGYFYGRFLALQSLVDQAFINLSGNRSTNSLVLKEPLVVSVTLENYPKPAYAPGMSTYMRVIIPIYSVIPLSQLVNNLLVLIVTEKEAKIKDGLKMIGISDAAYWCSWFVVYGAIVTFFSVAFTIVMYFFDVLSYVDPSLLFILFFSFGLSVVTFSFALTPFFHKPKTAGIVGTLLLQFTGMLFLVQTFVAGSGTWLIPMRLISSLAFTTALDDVTKYEYAGGIQWRDLTIGGRGEGVLTSLIFLIFDIWMYGLIALYLDNVLPNEYGVKKHPLFCFMPSFWFGSKSDRCQYTHPVEDDTSEYAMNKKNFEPISSSLLGKEAITTYNIKKTFTSWIGTNTVEAVKGISLKIYGGQITAILGRNGAGKTTLFNMLTGMVSPTSGTTVVFGYDVTDPYGMAQLRKMTGVCMQQDLHFNALTVEEHLIFYGKLRGLEKVELDKEINNLLEELKLNDRRNTSAEQLSGGQKRKLSVGIALIGDPKIILLDEPSAGVDPVSRRHLWSLLQRKKEGKVILLTTHFMDEADILADRKAIIHDGVLKCVGSSLFLKNRFGVGYHLTVELANRNSDTTASDNVINKWIPAALTSKKMIANEVKYALPHSALPTFPQLFAEIESIVSSPGSEVKSYGVSMTTLEEVFLRISNNADKMHFSSTDSEDEHQDMQYEETNLLNDVGELNRRRVHIFCAMCKMRILRLIRTPQSFFFMLFMPVLFVAIGFIIVKTQTIPKAALKLDYSNPSDIYPKSDLNIAVSSQSHDLQDLSKFINNHGFSAFEYSGDFSDLLNVNPGTGTMGAIYLNQAKVTDSFVAEVRINGTFLHGPPILLSIIDQYYLQKALEVSPDENEHYLNVTSEPFITKNNISFDQSTFYAVFLIGPAFVFISVGMVIEIVRDREIQARNHLRVNGLSFELYFSSIFTVYGFLSLFTTILLIALIYIFSLPSLTNPYAMSVLCGQLILYIAPSLLFSAIFSYMFDRVESAQAIFSQVASYLGMFVIIAVLVLDIVQQSNAALIVHGVFCAIDIFYIPYGIFYYINKQYIECTVQASCDSLNWSNYNGPEFTVIWICMACQIPFYIFLLYIIDIIKDGGSVKSFLRKQKTHISSSAISPTSTQQMRLSHGHAEDDEDIMQERQKVSNLFSSPTVNEKCVVAVHDLVKYYKSVEGKGLKKVKRRKKVVDQLSCMVEEGEVFGLLGHNGAGKTTTLKIITAQENADSGQVQLCGWDISSNKSEAFLKLGYCPQHDALWENIKLKEHLQLYAVIRGVAPEKTNSLIENFLEGLNIKEHGNKKAAQLSGGTKRKLSYAMSMLGAPKIVLLDEPSTGLDSQSKRFLWNTVMGTFKDTRGAILTTHSMEEADVLCSRIAIMVKGSILCIGSPQHLKSKYGTGYTLEIKLKSDLLPDATGDSHATLSGTEFNFILEHFQDCKLNEVFGNRAVFSIPNASIQSLSKTFSLLERLKQEHDIEEYAFSQTTLEQVFLTFAKENEENEEH